ncbi:TonB-dependent receptor [Tamlana agarivorans]|uniref:TonB-dependent receptor n=1 Tax=Pseudotamlana agarivorans TaxID=481183 RepID=A0ACC5U8I2_9FLAO|nr:TonB-dependent receptor [Tamlana agarivorans]MBU2950600.1 TonB-dependent receptor [Tamlana agarivorans]
MKIKLKSSYFSVRRKWLMNIMKTFIFLFFATAFSLSPSSVISQNSKVIIDVDKVLTVDEVFSLIKQQTDYKFIYQKGIFDKFPKVHLAKGKIKTIKLLEKSLSRGEFEISLTEDGTILIEESTVGYNEITQGVQVSGKVTDNSGIPLPGANIIEKGTSNGTQTDFDGDFSLTLQNANGVLVISYLGYTTKEVPVAGQANFKIMLDEDASDLDEVIVVGYGQQTKRELTGSISSVKSEDIEKIAVTGLDQAINGKAGGVHVLQNSGAPGGNMSVRIRGVGTTGNSEPLYVIDGVPVFNDNSNRSRVEFGQSSNVLNSINTADIESIEVLKDGASASIYGSRSANGVVLITTKSGKNGKYRVNVDSYTGMQSVRKKVDLLDASEYAGLMNEMFGAAGVPLNPRYNNPESLGEGTDWQDAIFRNAAVTNLQVSVSGGNEKSQFLLSGGYLNQEGIIKNSDFNRYSFRFNSKHKLSDKVSIGNNMTVSRVNENVVFSDQGTEGVVGVALGSHPTDAIYNPDGSYAGSTDPSPYGYVRNNALAIAEQRTNENNKYRFLGNIFAEYEIIDGLKYRLNLAADFLYSNSNNFVPTYANGNSVNPTASGARFDSNELIWLTEHTLGYSKVFNESHNLNLLAGFSQQASKLETHLGRKNNYPVNDLIYLNAGTAGDSAEGGASEWALRSYFGRVNYNFKERYLFSASVRADGSSRFADGNRYGYFPAFSAGWVISDEPFFGGENNSTDLKLRASWGQSGNQEIALFQYLPVLSTNGSYVLGSGSIAPGVFLPQIANPDITWETTSQTDIGIDLGLFKNKLNVTVDYYDKLTEDILLAQVIPLTAGLSLSGFSEFGTSAPRNPIVNAGTVRNKGFEAEVSYRDGKGDFTWEIGANITTVDNVVESLGSGSTIINSNANFETRTEVGQPIGSFYGYVTDGIFDTAAEVAAHATQPGAAPGDIRFKDIVEDGVIDDKDRTFIGNPIPDFYYGLNAQLGYKNLDFNFSFQGVSGNDIYNVVQIRNEGMTTNDNKYSTVLDRWTGPGTSNTIPRADASSGNNNSRISDRYVHDGSYLRLQNVQLGYTLSSGLTNRWGIDKMRLYVSAQNVFVATKYKIGHDPEIGAFNQNNLNSGIDRGAYPIPRTFLIGFNLGL